MKTLIKNGRVVTAVDDYKADVLIEDERVSVIGSIMGRRARSISAAPSVRPLFAGRKIGPWKRSQFSRRRWIWCICERRVGFIVPSRSIDS